jgi:hypothetical protein
MKTPTIPFVSFPKISRWSRDVIVTEKIDGTNAQIYIPEPGRCECGHDTTLHPGGGECSAVESGLQMQAERCGCLAFKNEVSIFAGSRNQWITPEKDNMGFARWVENNKTELLKLGPGSHFGEWWGPGIQRGYGLKEKKFSLFNVHRWGDGGKDVRPACCDVVPVLWRGPMDALDVPQIMTKLDYTGSIASPGFMRPEGIVIFCTAGGQLFKKTFEKDEGKEKNS